MKRRWWLLGLGVLLVLALGLAFAPRPASKLDTLPKWLRETPTVLAKSTLFEYNTRQTIARQYDWNLDIPFEEVYRRLNGQMDAPWSAGKHGSGAQAWFSRNNMLAITRDGSRTRATLRTSEPANLLNRFDAMTGRIGTFHIGR